MLGVWVQIIALFPALCVAWNDTLGTTEGLHQPEWITAPRTGIWRPLEKGRLCEKVQTTGSEMVTVFQNGGSTSPSCALTV